MSGEWRPDPGGQHQFRWWDGQNWTDHVANGANVSTAPLPATRTVQGSASQSPAPQTGGYSTGFPQARAQFRSLKGLSTALYVLLAVTMVFAVLLAVASLDRANLLSDIDVESVVEADDANGFVFGMRTLWTVGVIATAVVFIVWQYRHSANAQQLGGRLQLGPGWAIGGWFTPLANLVLPALQLREAAAASDPDSPPGAAASRGQKPPVIHVWAVLLGLSFVVWVISVQSFGYQDELRLFYTQARADEFARGDRLVAVASVLLVAAGVAAIVMIRTLTARQQQAIGRGSSSVPWGMSAQPSAPATLTLQPQAGGWGPQPQARPQQPQPTNWPPPPSAPRS